MKLNLAKYGKSLFNSKSYLKLISIYLILFVSCGWAGFGIQKNGDDETNKNIFSFLAGVSFGSGISSSSSSSSISSSVGILTATISPSDGSTNVSVSAGISIAFNRQINVSTIHSGTVYLTIGGTPVPGTLTIAGTSAAVFIPNSPLSYNTSYTLTVTTGVTDTLGPPQSLAANATSTFTTQADSSLPTVTLVSPGNGDSNIATNANIFITFSKPMTAATLNTTNITLLNGVTPVTGTVSTFGTTGAYFTPTTTLNHSTTYTINISTGVTDSIGNAIGSSYSATFTTAAATLDTTPPTVTSSNPSNGATSVAVTQTILITFSKPIASATINSTNITLMQGVTPIAGTVYAVGSNGAVFQSSSSLAYNTAYTLTLTTGITDTVSTPNALTNTTISFTTILDVAPTVSLVSPGSSATNVSPNTNIFITFSKSMMAATLNNTNITLLDGATPVTGTVFTFGTTGAYFTPAATLGNSKTYTVNISTGVTDLNGVAMASSYSSTFTTSAATPDTTPPTVTSISPSNGATSVSVSQTILITFSKPIASATINSTNITLMQGVTPITGTVYAVGSNGAVFQPSSSLAYNTAYTLTISTGIQDTATTPNSLATPVTVTFTTIADSLPFEVASVSPSNTATNIAINSGILVTFNKAVNPATLIGANITLTASSSYLLNITPIGTSTVLITTNSQMNYGSLHVLLITSGIQDTLGNPLTGVPYISIFTTASSDPDSGTVTTLAGTGSAGNVDGTGTAASFSSPQHLTMNTTEDVLYVTDTGNHRIRTIGVSNGVVVNVAGLTSGYTAATGTAARFNSPKGIFRTNGNLFYITDSGNNAMRIMTSANAVSNGFGTSVSTAGYVIANNNTGNRYRNPEGIAIDFLSGFFYTVDTGNHCIRRSTNNGSTNPTNCFAGANATGVSPFFGTSGFLNGSGTAARFNNPKGIAIDSIGTIFISDSGNHSIRMITPAGIVTTIAGSGASGYTNGVGGAATFNNPTDIAVYGNNTLYVADSGNCAIRKLILNEARTSATVVTYAGATPETPVGSRCGSIINSTRLTSRFNNPTGLWLATNNKLYVTDTGNHSIRVITY
ncbi:MAG: Ig-like domain-containing protein [Leptospiraceae bacterium]|nr:Ig-like domain-containing protein [Leptospiraceae bacterium]